MKDKGKVIKIAIVLCIFLIMFIPIFIDMSENRILKTISMDEVEKAISDTASYNYATIYVDSSDKEDIKDKKKELKEIVEKYRAKDEKTINAYYLDSNDLSSADLKILKLKSGSAGYIFAANGEVLYQTSEKLNKKSLENYVSLYTSSGVAKDLVNYKVVKNAKEYLNLVNGKAITMAVFGRTNCYYCQQFMPVFNTVAKEYKLNIYYFDSLKFDEKEYNKIMSAGLKIPASCSENGKEAKLEAGFGTPLTIFTKKGKVVDCISGYNKKSDLIKKLETVGMIKANK